MPIQMRETLVVVRQLTPMESTSDRRSSHPLWVGSTTGVIVAVIVVVSFGPGGLLLPRATVCQLGQNLGTFTIFTPAELTNIPYGGNMTDATNEENLTITSGSITTNPFQPWSGPLKSGVVDGSGENRAGIWATYADFNWTFYSVENVTKVGGSSSPCTQPDVAYRQIPGLGCGGEAIIPLANNSTDAIEPNVWNGTAGFNGSEDYPGCPVQSPGTYVGFDTSLNLNGSGNSKPVRWDLCGTSGYFPLVLNGIAEVPLEITAFIHGNKVSVHAALERYDNPSLPVYQGPTTIYRVPGGWNWTLAPVGPTTAPINPSDPLPALVAFERSAC